MGVKTLYVFWGNCGAWSRLIVMDFETGSQADFDNPIQAAKHMLSLVKSFSSHIAVVTSFEPPFEQVYGCGGSYMEVSRLLPLDQRLFVSECHRMHK